MTTLSRWTWPRARSWWTGIRISTRNDRPRRDFQGPAARGERMKRIALVTLFPEMFDAVADHGITARALEPLRAASDGARHWATQEGGQARVIYLSPQGRVLDQAGVEYLGELPNLVLVAGRYEGVDERLIELAVDEEWSIGDYVLSGGE